MLEPPAGTQYRVGQHIGRTFGNVERDEKGTRHGFWHNANPHLDLCPAGDDGNFDLDPFWMFKVGGALRGRHGLGRCQR